MQSLQSLVVYVSIFSAFVSSTSTIESGFTFDGKTTYCQGEYDGKSNSVDQSSLDFTHLEQQSIDQCPIRIELFPHLSTIPEINIPYEVTWKAHVHVSDTPSTWFPNVLDKETNVPIEGVLSSFMKICKVGTNCKETIDTKAIGTKELETGEFHTEDLHKDLRPVQVTFPEYGKYILAGIVHTKGDDSIGITGVEFIVFQEINIQDPDELIKDGSGSGSSEEPLDSSKDTDLLTDKQVVDGSNFTTSHSGEFENAKIDLDSQFESTKEVEDINPGDPVPDDKIVTDSAVETKDGLFSKNNLLVMFSVGGGCLIFLAGFVWMMNRRANRFRHEKGRHNDYIHHTRHSGDSHDTQYNNVEMHYLNNTSSRASPTHPNFRQYSCSPSLNSELDSSQQHHQPLDSDRSDFSEMSEISNLTNADSNGFGMSQVTNGSDASDYSTFSVGIETKPALSPVPDTNGHNTNSWENSFDASRVSDSTVDSRAVDIDELGYSSSSHSSFSASHRSPEYSSDENSSNFYASQVSNQSEWSDSQFSEKEPQSEFAMSSASTNTISHNPSKQSGFSMASEESSIGDFLRSEHDVENHNQSRFESEYSDFTKDSNFSDSMSYRNTGNSVADSYSGDSYRTRPSGSSDYSSNDSLYSSRGFNSEVFSDKDSIGHL